MPKFPDRWFDYTNVGDVIQGTRLITFKVPLKESFFAYNNRIPQDSRFTPTTLLECMNDKGLKLGLVIDLTFTNRYYDQEEFTSQGVQYKKIFVEGHVIPKKEVIESFYEAIDKFLETSEEDSLIGVHCTHGVNRTGYVVCRYMVEHLGMKATDALEAYGKARGYPVERVNYINDLKRRAGEPYEEVEEETSDSHEGSSSRGGGHSSHHHRGRGRGHNHRDERRGHHQSDEDRGHHRNDRMGYEHNQQGGRQGDNYGHHNYERQNEHFGQHQYGPDSENWRNPRSQFHGQNGYGWHGNQFDPNAWNGYGNGYPPYGNGYNQHWGRGANQGMPNGYGPHIQYNGYSDYSRNNSYDRRSYSRQNSDSRKEGRGNRSNGRQRPF